MTSILPPALERDPTWPDPLPTSLSPSALTTFLSCPEKWRRTYLQGERERPSAALLIGRTDSKTRELDLGQKITSGINLPLDDVRLFAAESFDQEVEAEGGSSEIEWEDVKPGAAKDTAVGVVGAYAQTVSQTILPLAVEETCEIAVPGLVPIVRGYLDVRENGWNREVKTSKKRVSSPSSMWRMQTSLYSAATGRPTRFDVSVKTQRPYVMTADTELGLWAHTDGRAGERIARIALSAAGMMLDLLERLGPDEVWPGTGAAQFVPACGICGYRDQGCPWV